MDMKDKPDWIELADKHDECRCFIEFAYVNQRRFYAFIKKEIVKR